MNVLVIDPDVARLDLCWRAVESGHKVRWWIPPMPNGAPAPDGDGFPGITKVKDWHDSAHWVKDGLIVNGHNTKYTWELDNWRGHGYTVFGPSIASAKLEISRAAGMAALEKKKIQVPPYNQFASLKEALSFAKKSDEAWVFKTLGSEEDKSLSYVASSPEDMVMRLQRWIDQGMNLKGPCMLQEKIEGLEIGVSAWVGKKGFGSTWNINFEFKKLMPGDKGPNTGEMGTVTQYVDKELLADEVLKPMEDYLVSIGHIGDVDLNCIVNEKGAFPLEWTTRFGDPSTGILYACHEGDCIEWMYELAKTGRNTLEVSGETAVGVGVFRPPFPEKNSDPESSVGLPIWGLEDIWDQASCWQVRRGSGPAKYETTGDYIAVVVGKAQNVSQAGKRAYAAIEKIKTPDMIVRNDIGEKLKDELPELHKLGYAKEVTW